MFNKILAVSLVFFVWNNLKVGSCDDTLQKVSEVAFIRLGSYGNVLIPFLTINCNHTLRFRPWRLHNQNLLPIATLQNSVAPHEVALPKFWNGHRFTRHSVRSWSLLRLVCKEQRLFWPTDSLWRHVDSRKISFWMVLDEFWKSNQLPYQMGTRRAKRPRRPLHVFDEIS